MPGNKFITVSAQQMQEHFLAVLLKYGFTEEQANDCARIFTANSLDGIYTHGVNRFPRFVQYIKDGYVKPAETPSLKNKFGGIEQWDGNLGPGPL
ncbi:MAG: Ldh family oxidoreductase, partial [Ferruginibacter sp.]